jgi:MFS family permease
VFKSLLLGVPEKLRHNFISLYWDIAVWGLYTGATAVFLNVYATRAGATGEQIGLLNAGPAVVSLIMSIPAGLLARRFDPKRGVVLGAILGRTLLLAYVFVPSLVPATMRVDVLIVLSVVMAFPNTLLGVCFGPFFMCGMPGEWRATVVGMRNAINAIITFAVTLVCGQLLIHLPSPLGYQVVFFIGFVGAVLTIWTLGSVRMLDGPGLSMPAPPKSSGTLRALFPSGDPAGMHYIVVLVMLFALNSAAYMIAPLIPLFTINILRLNDAVISVGSASGSMLVFVISLFVARLTARFGNRNLTALGVALLCIQTLVLALAHDATLFIASSLIGGTASGVLSAASFNYHLENVPRKDQTAWISWNSMLGNVAALLGSVAGPVLAGVIGIPATLIAMGVVRLLIGGAIYLWG